MESRRDTYWLIALAAAAGLGIIAAGRQMNAPETVESLRKQLLVHPDDANLHERLGNALLRDHRTADAKNEFSTAMKDDPTNASAPWSLASLDADTGDETEAMRILEASLKTHPDDAATNELLADLAIKSLGEEIEMPVVKGNYIKANRNDPTRPISAVVVSKLRLADGDVEGAAKVLEMPLVAHPRDAAVHLQLARVLAREKRYTEANDQFNTGTVLDPNNAGAFCDWGTMLVDAAWTNSAERVLQRAVELNDKSARAHMELGRALRDLALNNQGKMEDAQAQFVRAVDVDRNYAPTYLEWARTMLAIHNEPSALKLLQDSVMHDPRYADAWVEMAHLRMDADDPTVRDPFEGLLALKQAVDATDRKDLGLLAGFAKALAKAKLFDQAVDEMDVASQLPGLTGGQKEAIAELRQGFVIAPFPDNDGLTEILNIDALIPPGPLDYPAWDLLPDYSAPVVRLIDVLAPPPAGHAKDPARGNAPISQAGLGP